MLIDQAIIQVSSGKGGDGHVSFHRAKYVPKGGPDGGDGGDGGSVYMIADPNLATLLDFSSKHHWDAPPGEDGGKRQCAGRKGEDLNILVPVGTLVFEHDTHILVGDLKEPGQKLLIAKGGRGGWGNEHFKSSTNQAPRQFTPGQPAVTRLLRLELKLLADIGILGKPNAGKSTLISRVSRARPKIADYPFTTLEPGLGIAELPGHRRIVLADIPGLIEGAHLGHGLGIRFLRHVERTRVLIHLIEIVPADGSDPVHNYRVVRKELESYSPKLAQKPEIVAVSKLDLIPEEEQHEALKKISDELGKSVVPISSVTGYNLPKLMEYAWKVLQENPGDATPFDLREYTFEPKADDPSPEPEAGEEEAQNLEDEP